LGYPLSPPEAATPPKEYAVSLDAAAIIRAQFAQDERPKSRAVVALFNAILTLLTGSKYRH